MDDSAIRSAIWGAPLVVLGEVTMVSLASYNDDGVSGEDLLVSPHGELRVKKRKHSGIYLLSTPIWKRWPSEEGNFTPWVAAEALDTFKELLGTAVDVVALEHPVGPFEADIVLKRQDDEQLVVVENYLYTLDHDHIGKALTYAMLLKASAVIWLVGDVRPEHAQAVRELAGRLSGVDLYLLRVRIPVGELDGGFEAEPEFEVYWPQTWGQSS